MHEMNEVAISLKNVDKAFRKKTVIHNYGTFKSLILNKFKGVRAKGATKDSFEVLKDISFDIPKGETWGIIGKNGAGKSTLLKLIAGIYKEDAGKVTVNGKVSALIELGAGFHPDFSGRENIYINASILGFSKKEITENFNEIVAFAELEEFIDNPVRTYSSGMFMRLGFSVAVHVDPDVLLVDEVLAVGDEVFGHKCRVKLENFKKEGKTIILVSHSLGEVEKWCDGVIWVDRGSVREIGKANRVIDSYLSTVAELEDKARKDDREREEGKREPRSLSRWGEREVEITKVEMCDRSGEARFVYQSNSFMTLEMEYTAHQMVEEPVFGFAIHKQDGALCYGSNTEIEDIQIDKVEGNGKISIRFDNMGLVEGSYTISAAVHAKDGYAYDYHDQMYEFSIRSKIKDDGVFRPPHAWVINGASKNKNNGAQK